MILDTIKISVIILMLGILSGAIVVVLIDESTMKYKYSIDVPCFDKFENEIYNLTCQKDIMCGVIFGNTFVGDNVYSCNESIGLLRNMKESKREVKK